LGALDRIVALAADNKKNIALHYLSNALVAKAFRY
jgi:hypothetical protein